MSKKVSTSILIAAVLTVSSQWAWAANHSKLSSEHIQVAERFVSRNLKTNGVFDLNKISQFVSRLEQEKKALASDMYETKIIEKLELEIESHKDAVKSAQKELDSKKSKYLQAYEQFLIPRMQSLYACVSETAPIQVESVCSGIADEFLTGYAAFYLPEAPRNIFHQDLNYPFIAKNILVNYNYKKYSNDVEANNLRVEQENFALTQSCLPNIQLNQILEQTQIVKLKKCGVDISIYNPADQTLWRKHTAESFQEAKNRHENWFPTDSEIIYFKKMKYSSAGSPKMEGEFERNGKDIDVKIKLGFETHTEITTSILGKMLGMYQDTSIHRKRVKIYFKGDMDYDAFKAQWSRKYSGINKEYVTYVADYGSDSLGKYIVLQDVQLSINDPNFLRVAPYEPAGWDLPNRREHRAQVLWFGLVNMIDVKTGNHEVLFEKTSKGLVPRYSMQDVGYSLHFQVNLLKPLEILRSVLSWGVNTYSETFLDWDEDSVHIQWSDVLFSKKRFDTTTFSDLKWMARQMAKLSHEDIKYAVVSGNFPPEVADLYIHKITNRRNEVVKAFGLQKEFALYSVPDLDHYSPNKKVKDGLIVVSHFEGYANYELPRNTLLPVILQAASSFIDLEALEKKLKAKISSDISVTYSSDLNKLLNVKDISSGIGVELKRDVSINNQFVVREGTTQAFAVKDRLAIEINIGSSLFTTLEKLFPKGLSVNGNIKVWRREFEHIHFADTWLEGYQSKVKLFSFIPNWKNCVIECLQRGEVLKISDSYGASVNASAPLGEVAGLPFSIGGGVSWKTSKPVYFSRDQLNQLLVYEAENVTTDASVSGGINQSLDLFLLNLPFLEFTHTSGIYTHTSALYRFSAAKSVENFSALEQLRDKEEKELLNSYLDSGDSDPLVLSKRELDIKAKGEFKKNFLHFLFLFKNESSTGHSRATVNTSNNEVRQFQRYTGEQTNLFGAEKRILVIDSKALVVYQDTTKISIEMDEAEPDNIVSYVEVWNYERKLNHKDLVSYIGDLNKYFSQSAAMPFYRDYYLPPKDQVNKYRKLYGHTRIYFYGDALVKALTQLSDRQLKALYSQSYKGERGSCNLGKNTAHTCWYAALERSFVSAVHDLQRHQQKDKEYLERYFKLIAAMKIRENGIDLVKKVISEKDMFVMGEIYGVYPSFSTMQQDEQVAGRRFAAKSWGNYRIPPLRKFLNKTSLNAESIYINGEINFDDIFGSLPSGNVDYF